MSCDALMTRAQNDKDHETRQDSFPQIGYIYFYLTKGCNLACRHCWLAPKFDPTGNRYPSLPVELFETAIQEAKPLGLKGVKLTGGEPLLHPQFKELLEIVRREDLSLNIETNGVLCTPAIAKEIAKSSDQRFVSVSIDGADHETHELVRGVAGSFELAKDAVRNLAAVDTPPQVIISLMQCNAHQVDEIVRLAENLGASSVKFNIIQPTGRGKKIHEDFDTLNVTELIKLGRYVDMELAPTTKLRLFFSYPPAFRPLSRIASGDSCEVCGVFGIIGVIADGHYALCGIGEHLPEFTFGVVGVDRLEDVWRQNAILNELRAGLPSQLNGICSRCLMKDSCLGFCVAQNYYRAGNVWAPFWFCEHAAESGLFPDSRLAVAKV